MTGNRPPRRLLAILALVSCLSCISWSQPSANSLFDDSIVHQIQLTVSPGDWASLQHNYLDNTYYHATLSSNGQRADIGIRSHGGGSRSPVKPNLDINIDKYNKTQTLNGLSFFILKANNEDPSNLHEWLSFKLFRRMGLPAPREAPAQVYINGQLLGFYFIVEHEDTDYAERILGENTGYLYEWQVAATYNFEYLGSDPKLYAPYLDLKSDQAQPDLQTFAGFISAINLSPDTRFRDAVSQYIDPKLFFTHAAVENVLAESDGLVGGIEGTNNFYLYQFAGTKQYQLLAWDKDLTFSDSARDILTGISTGDQINVLAHRLYAIPDFARVYQGALLKAAALLGGANGWGATSLAAEYQVIHNAALNDPNKQCMAAGVLSPCGTTDFEASIASMQDFLAARSAFVQSAVAATGYQPASGLPVLSNAATGLAGGQAQLVPGSLVSITGTGLGIEATGSGSPLPRVLAKTYVTVDGLRAPLFSTADGQVQIQVPWDTRIGGTSSIVADVNGDLSNTLELPVSASAPAIFAIVHLDGTPVSPDSPGQPGEALVVYATGLGLVNPQVSDGVATTPDSLASTVQTPQLSIGGSPADVIFSGLAPGFVGLYQVNVAVPLSLPAGTPTQVTFFASGQ